MTFGDIEKALDSKKFSSTAFDTQVVSTSETIFDLPSSVPFNTERYELVQEGTVDDTNFTNGDGRYKLAVNGDSGDAHELKARQLVTYVPNFEFLWGVAYYMENQIEAGQKLTVKLADDTDDNGYFLEITNDQRRVYIKKSGSEVDSKEWGVDNGVDPYEGKSYLDETRPQVARTYLNWYGVGPGKFTLSYTNSNSEMNNEVLASCANGDTVATEEINLQLSVRLECTESTSANTVNVMSLGALVRGSSSATNRLKSSNTWDAGGSIDSTTYSPILAVRRRSGYDNIPTQLDSYSITPSDTMEVVAVAYDEDNLTASNWDVPPQMDADNTAIEQTESISSAPLDGDGNPDARHLDLVAAPGAQGNETRTAKLDTRNNFYKDEVVVFMARTKSASGASTDLLVRTRQEW